MRISPKFFLAFTFLTTVFTCTAQKAILPYLPQKTDYCNLSNDGTQLISMNREGIYITDIKSGAPFLEYTYEHNFGQVMLVALSNSNDFLGILHTDETGCFMERGYAEALLFTILRIENANRATVELSFRFTQYHEYNSQNFALESTADNGFLVKLKAYQNAFGYAAKFRYDSQLDEYDLHYELGEFPEFYSSSFDEFHEPRLRKIKGMDGYDNVLFYDICEEKDLFLILAPTTLDIAVVDENDLIAGSGTYGVFIPGINSKGKPRFIPVMWDNLDSYQSDDPEYTLTPYNFEFGRGLSYLVPDYEHECLYGVGHGNDFRRTVYLSGLFKETKLTQELNNFLRFVPFRFDYTLSSFSPIIPLSQVVSNLEKFSFLTDRLHDSRLTGDKARMCFITESFPDADRSIYHINGYNIHAQSLEKSWDIPLRKDERMYDIRFSPNELLHLVTWFEDELTVHTIDLKNWQKRSTPVSRDTSALFTGTDLSIDNTNGLQLRLLDRNNVFRQLTFSLSGIPLLEQHYLEQDSLYSYERNYGQKRNQSAWMHTALYTLNEPIFENTPFTHDDDCADFFSERGYNDLSSDISGFCDHYGYDTMTTIQLMDHTLFDGVYRYTKLSIFRKNHAYLSTLKGIDVYLPDSNKTTYAYQFNHTIVSFDVSMDERLMAVLTRDQKITLINLEKHTTIAEIYLFDNASDWVIILPDNYYFGTRNATDQVVFRFNRELLSADYFDLKYNRPDMVLKALGCAGNQVVEAYEKAYHRRLSKLGLSEEMLKYDFDVPYLEIDNKADLPASTDEGFIDIRYKLFDARYPLLKVNVWVNDVAVFGNKGITVPDQQVKSYQGNLRIPIASGKNEIVISCMNTIGIESNRETMTVLSESASQKQDLYLLSVGVGNYADTRYNLDYPAKDARDIAGIFKENSIYDSVHLLTLTDEQVTREALTESRTFFSNAGIDDQVIVFVAGHGVLDASFDYYYASHDMDFSNPSNRGIPYELIESLLDGIKPLKKLLFMDTCHSGEVDKEDVQQTEKETDTGNDIVFRNVGVAIENKEQQLGLKNTSELMKSLFTDMRKGTGATVISSASGVEFAMESDRWKNGLFTYCLINGLTTLQADLNQDNQVTVSELQQYVQNQVHELSGGKQTPTSRIENKTLDYRIW